MIPFRLHWLLLAMLVFTAPQAQSSDHTWLFKNRKEGYNVYRIPTIIRGKSGKLLAFCEGRDNLFDNGDIDLVMKSSADNGKTWSNLTVIWDGGKNTCGNPSPVVDEKTGDIILVASLNNDKVFVLRSTDEGDSWQTPKDITASVKEADWEWYATGPVHAIQLGASTYSGRIIVPCNHTTETNNKHISHTIYSDDGGYTWQKGGNTATEDTDECTAAELSDGRIVLNMRNADRSIPNRKVSYSHDGGLHWTKPQFDSTLIEPVCQGSLLSHTELKGLLLFTNPKHKKRRKNLTLSVSKDDGNSWSSFITVYKKKSAYSDIAILPNGDICCIFETGKLLPYGGIVVTLIPKEKIMK